MKKILLLLLFPVLLLFCFGQKRLPADDPPPPPVNKPPKTIKYVPPKLTVAQRLENYLDKQEIRPYIIVNNIEEGPFLEISETEMPLGKHKVKWIRKEKETEVEIDGDRIPLKGKISLNHLWGETGDDVKVDFADDWKHVKLYKFNDREVIGISMTNTPCTGTGCSITFFLVYDLQTKKANFFGSYRASYELKLYSFGERQTIDFLAQTYFSDASIESQKLFHYYSLNDKGEFVLQKDSQQKPYFFKRFFVEKNFDDKEIDNKFIHNWVEEIK